MRDIKFRGKRIGNNEWTYGNFYYWTRYKKDLPIIGKGVQNGSVYGFEVDPNTVGQFTGLTNKNGKEIYEGDIIETPLGNIVEIRWCQVIEHGESIDGSKVIDEFKYTGFASYNIKLKRPFHLDNTIVAGKVIGNIHDNPELLNQ